MTIADRVPPVDLDLAARPPSSAFQRWLAPAAFAVFGLVNIFVLGLNAHHGDATFAFSQPFAKVTVPNLTLPAAITCYVCGAITLVMAALRAFLPLGTTLKRMTIAVVIFLFVLALLCWADAGQTTSFNVVNLLQGTFNDSIPIMLGALTGVVCSRSGVINVGIEGQLLLGAFTAAIVASGTGSLWLGLVCGALAGSLVGVLLAVFAIGYRVDQVILGVVLNTLILGLTGYLYDDLMVPYANTLNSPATFSAIKIPLFGDIPIIGPVFFDSTIFLYLTYIALAAMIFGRYTPFGAIAAALLFGFTTQLQSILSTLNTPIQSNLLLMTPYIVTIVVLAGLVGKVRGPRAEGIPYVKA